MTLSMQAYLDREPLKDPEALAPVTSRMVDDALDRATVAQAEAQRRWRLALEALETNHDVEARSREAMRALAELRVCWAYYHSAQADEASHRVA